MHNNPADFSTVFLFLRFIFDDPVHQESPSSRRFASSSATNCTCNIILDRNFCSMLFFRVYDPETKKIVQKNVGHTDSVRSIIHIPERSQVRTSANLTSIRSNVFR